MPPTLLMLIIPVILLPILVRTIGSLATAVTAAGATLQLPVVGGVTIESTRAGMVVPGEDDTGPSSAPNEGPTTTVPVPPVAGLRSLEVELPPLLPPSLLANVEQPPPCVFPAPVATAAAAGTCCCCFVERFACTGGGGPGDTSHSIFRRNFQRGGNNGALLSAAAAHLPRVRTLFRSRRMDGACRLVGLVVHKGLPRGAVLYFSETVATGSCARTGQPDTAWPPWLTLRSIPDKSPNYWALSSHFSQLFACYTCTPTPMLLHLHQQHTRNRQDQDHTSTPPRARARHLQVRHLKLKRARIGRLRSHSHPFLFFCLLFALRGFLR
uniref:Putative secreted protein n=1 Tax=Anopheles marajoara TaxID=58244 RepID=A0A2M4C5J1_9DIPT